MTLPYHMGNAGDLLKHGVLAEFVRWRCESGGSCRFIDLFGGEPEGPAVAEVARRVRALPNGALRAAQTAIDEGRYRGSGLVALRAGAAGPGGVRVLTADREPERRERLRAAGLSMLDEEFPGCGARAGRYDAWTAFDEVAPALHDDDLVLLDPFKEFVRDRAPKVVPRMADAARRGAVLSFALNLDPRNAKGRRFDALLERYLPGAWRMTCPPLPGGTEIKGESKFHADVVLAARPLLGSPDAHRLRTRLEVFTRGLARVLDLPPGSLDPREVPRGPVTQARPPA